MKKNGKRLLSLLLTAAALFSSVLYAFAETKETSAPKAITAEDFLVTKGKYLVNQRGETVTLHGVNLGAWLIFEDWLCAYEEATDHYDVLTKLTERFGTEKAYELMKVYQDNFITGYDLDEIVQMGFNCVRVPFWFRNFYYDDNGTKILDETGEWDFSRLDWVVEESAKRGLYVILDLHGAVGYQSDAPHSGRGNSVGLFAKDEKGERYRELTNELWFAIAERYKGNPAVAMYDLLNEPMCDVPASGLRRRINNTMIYTRLYDTVRKADPDHIITLECIWSAASLPHKTFKGWENVVYQFHFYQNSDFEFNFKAGVTRAYYFGVPLLIGEFFPHKATTWKNCFTKMNKYDYSWMLWTYKATGHGMWDSDWCLRGSRDGFERAKIETDSFEEIARKWGEGLRTETGFQDSGHYDRNVKNFI